MSTATEAETTTDDDREAGERPRQGDVLYKKEKIWVWADQSLFSSLTSNTNYFVPHKIFPRLEAGQEAEAAEEEEGPDEESLDDRGQRLRPLQQHQVGGRGGVHRQGGDGEGLFYECSDQMLQTVIVNDECSDVRSDASNCYLL